MATCINRYTRQRYYCQSRWGSWGRWVALVVILIVAILFFFLLACISQRRRRKAGRTPFYGTGWTTKLPGNATNNTQQTYQAPPPQYGQQNYNPPTGPPPSGGQYGQHGGENQSYFGGQRDVEMQTPQNVYNNNSGFQAPPGPPPNKVY